MYSRLSSEQVAGIEAQHNEIGAQAGTGMVIGAALAVPDPSDLVVAGAVAKGGREIVAQLTKGAIKDDVKDGVRQVVKTGGERQMGRDMAHASRGAEKTNPVPTRNGVVNTAEHSDGTTFSARNFSSDGRPTLQLNSPNVDEVIKVRYDP